MSNFSDLVTIFYVLVFKFNLLFNKNIKQNINQRMFDMYPKAGHPLLEAFDAPSPTGVDLLLGWPCLK